MWGSSTDSFFKAPQRFPCLNFLVKVCTALIKKKRKEKIGLNRRFSFSNKDLYYCKVLRTFL